MYVALAHEFSFEIAPENGITPTTRQHAMIPQGHSHVESQFQ
jgi:hypothetical protein